MTSSPFGCFRCTGTTAHYWLPDAKRPLCGAAAVPGKPAANLDQPGGIFRGVTVCPACRAANVNRWAKGGAA